ncbi:unnamed protein product [Spodoptera littoralis]|uniref:Regulatory protein zeste n=1 Tax=Spodoptera littoralis TaxID=7109 RepID=A0A9P0N647_SPOLI|nr:unnamed protein product [Spodoptera littoralis]CAH1642904.1 unnamed protein product [Spodoptera littoralis]
METRVRSSMIQFVTLLKFMEEHGDITRLRGGPQTRRKAKRLWRELALTLNAVDNVRQKSPDKWKKVWTDWKSKTKRKARSLRQANADSRPTGELMLTPLERRILAVPSPWEVKQETEEVLNEELEEQEDNSPQNSVNAKQSDEELSASEEAASDMDQTESPTDVKPPTHGRSTTKPTRTPYNMRSRLKSDPSTRSPGKSNTGLEKVLNQFASIELRRLQAEEERDRLQHERETRWIEVESERNDLLRSLVNIARSWLDFYTDPLKNGSSSQET